MKSNLLFGLAAAFNTLADNDWQSDWNGAYFFKNKTGCTDTKDTCVVHCSRALSVNATIASYQLTVYSVNVPQKDCPCNSTNGYYLVLGGKPMDGYQVPNSNVSVSIEPNPDGSGNVHVDSTGCQIVLHRNKKATETAGSGANATTTSDAALTAANGLLALGALLLF
ncbi:hypothetical protein HDV01_005478 [Terramyces sp. JEL0728]|nr:hypothetical protein HDV01_005478 [Terramyces sp. JEL0728]